MNTFILHYKPLVERKEYMDEQLAKLDMKAQYITEFDKEEMTDYDKEIFDYEKVWTNRTLFLSNSSLIAKHLEVYKRVVDNDFDFGLIIEDDVILSDDFKEKYYDYYKQLPENWDILFYGDGYGRNLHVPKKLLEEQGGNVFLKSHKGNGIKDREKNGWPVCAGASRCSDCYLISKKAAERILVQIKEIRRKKRERIFYPSDLWMNNLFRGLNFKVYWAEPTISTQGTETGKWKSAHK
jgi:GR25 family glycosyltransferase involved in LPS biosynthesis